MNATMARVLDGFSQVKVAVLGEAILDTYLEGSSDRLCQEAPVPVVAVSERTDAPGGAANTAVNIRSLGARCALLSVVGDDAEARLLRRALEAQDVATEALVVDRFRRTLAKRRVVSNSHLLVRFDEGTTCPLERDAEAELVARLSETFERCDALVISDYGYGVLTDRIVDSIARLQRGAPRLIVVDAKGLTRYRAAGVTAVKPNYDQALAVLGAPRPAGKADVVALDGDRLLEVTGAQIVAVTLDAEGAVVFERTAPPYRVYARPARNTTASGAGDTFTAALTLALAAGADTPAACEVASTAAAVVVAKDRTATCSSLEIREHLTAEAKFLSDRARLAERVDFYRSQGRRVAFTNGCFDILHRGHITYLNRAKSLADVLIVGVNTDEGVALLKGPGRPINSLEDRIEVLAALSSVDHIVAFPEDTPVELIRTIRPDVFVKGGDYTIEMLPEAPVVEDLGGVVRLLPYVDDRSTTAIVERIRARQASSPAPALDR